MVVGAGHRGHLHRALHPSVSRYCLAHACCPVLAIPPSPLEADLAAAHLRNVWRLRLDTRHFTKEATPPHPTPDSDLGRTSHPAGPPGQRQGIQLTPQSAPPAKTPDQARDP
ncbi:universal stress protein [Streptomyces sp. NBC_01445]|uniref:universal stress protein n=1 Tax=Streptomyces sp. NBC_01445 TaxID=2903869 RepID=UPI002DD98133|nr:universal stress protein [Streptomyces sp. NBC_01445]